MKSNLNKLFILSITGIAAASFGCDDSSSITSLKDLGCQSGYELCGDTCCKTGNCDADNVCHDTDNGKCGEDQIECNANQVCSEGKCVATQEACLAPKKVCEGSCVSVSSDPRNCGDCGTKCDDTESCQNGSCVKGCADGYTLIDGQCYNTSVDSEHCGDNHTACGANQYCAEDKADNIVKCMCMSDFYDCDGDASNGCEASVQCDYVCETGEKACGPNMCCPESDSCCGSSCCAEGTTCCGENTCYDLQNDAHHCGGCENECKASETCLDGVCIDNAEQTCEDPALSVCWGKCVDLQTDSQNCESCGTKCDDGFECKNAQCVVACTGDLTACGDACADLTKDSMNCGACGNKCGTDSQCVTDETGTSCKLTSEINPELVCNTEEDLATEGYIPKLECWGKCIDGTSDNDNCGRCGNKCDEKYTCINSACAYACAEGLTACDEDCLDLTKDNMNCGACGNKCGTDSQCVTDESGTSCKLTSEINPELVCNTEEDLATEGYIPKLECWGKCVDGQTDKDNCGTCGNACGEDMECKDGVCSEIFDPTKCNATGYQLCYGNCVNLMEDDNNCGACLNACGNGEKCVSGVCELQCGDLTNCGGACVDTTTSANHCGGCGIQCKAGQECVGTNCQCAAGKHDCDGIASNGCESDVECTCEPGAKQACWRGDPQNRNVGACKDGEQTCDASGRFWGPCNGGTYPSAITCNNAGLYKGGDQNCNGINDKNEDCVSSCDLRLTDSSYIGCEYWAAFLQNYSGYSYVYMDMTLVISNPSETETADIYVWDKSSFLNSTANNMMPYLNFTVPPKGVVYKTIVGTPSGSNTSNPQKPGTTIYDYMMYQSMQAPRAFKVRSSVPIVVYQFNPYGKSQGYTADASLLLPANTLGNDYINLAYYGSSGASSAPVISIIATEPGETVVTVTPTLSTYQGTDGANGQSGNKAFDSISANTTKSITINQFDILSLMTSSGGEFTGSHIEANKKVSVFGGAACTDIRSACDHTEEQLFPTNTWGTNYYAIRAGYNLSSNSLLGTEPDDYYIVAQQDDTQVTIFGDQGTNTTDTITLNAYTGGTSTASLTQIKTNNSFRGTVKLNAGQFTKITTNKNFEISATKPILVGQFIDDVNSIGDPGYMLNVPIEQYRQDYSFSIPQNYEYDFVTLVAPQNTKIYYTGAGYKGTSYNNKLIDTLPSTVFSGWKPIGSKGYVYGYLDLDEGTHSLVSDQKFGATGYGFGDANSSTDDTSYAYPIGLNLDRINNTN